MEPNYEYIKGQGWVVTPAVPAAYFRMTCGTPVRIEMRKPNVGERATWHHVNSGWGIKEFKNFLSRFSYLDFDPYTQMGIDDAPETSEDPGDRPLWCVVTAISEDEFLDHT